MTAPGGNACSTNSPASLASSTRVSPAKSGVRARATAESSTAGIIGGAWTRLNSRVDPPACLVDSRRPAEAPIVDVGFLLDIPLGVALVLVVVLPNVLLAGLVVLVRRVISQETLKTNNEIAGYVYAAIGVIYAVVLAFVFVVIWEQFRDTGEVVEREASALASMYREVQGVFPNEQGLALRAHLYLYAREVVADEWPLMSRGLSTGSER